MARNLQKFDPHEFEQPYCTVIVIIIKHKHTVPYN